jgi:hypothetical protein
MPGEVFAIGPCWLCKQPFSFDPETVPVVYVDPQTGLPPADNDDVAILRSRRRQLCYGCARDCALIRQAQGLADLWGGRWGTPPAH